MNDVTWTFLLIFIVILVRCVFSATKMRSCVLRCLVAASFLGLTSAGTSEGPIKNFPPGYHPPSNVTGSRKSELPIKIFPQGPHPPSNWCNHARELADANTLFGGSYITGVTMMAIIYIYIYIYIYI